LVIILRAFHLKGKAAVLRGDLEKNIYLLALLAENNVRQLKKNLYTEDFNSNFDPKFSLLNKQGNIQDRSVLQCL
jgi:hypothetical protein